MIFRTLSDILYCLWKIVADYNYFCRTLLLRPFQMFGSINLGSSPSVLGSDSGMFRHIQSLFKSIFTHIQELSVFLAYSKLQNIPITKHIQTLRYIHNTILNNFTKARSWPDAVLNATLFYKCYLTSRVTLRIFNVIFRTYSGIFNTYSVIFSPAKEY